MNDLLQIGKFEICSPRSAHARPCQLRADGSTIRYARIPFAASKTAAWTSGPRQAEDGAGAEEEAAFQEGVVEDVGEGAREGERPDLEGVGRQALGACPQISGVCPQGVAKRMSP